MINTGAIAGVSFCGQTSVQSHSPSGDFAQASVRGVEVLNLGGWVVRRHA